MRRERGEMTTGSIIQIAIIVVALLLASYFLYTRVLKSDLPDEMGAEWLCKGCDNVFYVTPAKLESLLDSKQVKSRQGIYRIQCPKCKEWEGFRAFKCPNPECEGYYTQLDKVNNQLICPHCKYNPALERRRAEEAEGEGG